MGDRPQWESRYRERPDDAVCPPSQFLVEQCPHLPCGRALDVASGDGRHALYLARLGWAVDAIDFAYAGLARLLAIARRDRLAVAALQADLESFPLPCAHYDVIVNVRYLQRSLVEALKRALRPGGMIVFETFLRDPQQLGHPRNPAFLLERGELAERFSDFEILVCREGRCDTESGPALLAHLLARRPSTVRTVD